jgi:hypothetical protein
MSASLRISRATVVRAVATILATVASFVSVYALCMWAGAQSTGPAIGAAVFSLGYNRRPAKLGARGLLVAPVLVALLALVAFGVGRLLLTVPLAGAAVFVAGMFLSVYARNATGMLRQLGSLIALPLIAMLVVPATPIRAPGGPLVDLALAASAGVISLAFAMLARSIVRRLRLAPAEYVPEEKAPQARAGLTPVTRVALQMAVALAAAFAVGFVAFPGHWAWCVLTAFIVSSGARGRGDAAYKGVLRLGGAVGGTLVAALCAHVWAPAGMAEAILIFALLFVALLLREANYAFWAAGMTLILALLARSSDGFNLAMLAARVEAILAGSVCAVVAAWFVFPIRTEDVIRRRLADALKAFDDVVVHAHDVDARSAHAAHLDRRMRELEDVAPPVRWHRRIFAMRATSEHPARWIDLAHEIRAHARAVTDGDPPGDKQAGRLRRAIGISRRAIGQHRDRDAEGRVPIDVALVDLRDTLATLDTSSRPKE